MGVRCWKAAVSEAVGIWPVFISFVSEAVGIDGIQKAPGSRSVSLSLFLTCFFFFGGGGDLDSSQFLVEMEWDSAEKSRPDLLLPYADTR